MSLVAGHVHDLSALSLLEWAIVGLSALLVIWVLWRAVVLTLDPGEEDPHHLKRSILDDEPRAAGTAGRRDALRRGT